MGQDDALLRRLGDLSRDVQRGGRAAFRRVPADGIELYLDERIREPNELELDVGGLRRKHVHAYWDGCAYVV
jgi:hypothetical protein